MPLITGWFKSQVSFRGVFCNLPPNLYLWLQKGWKWTGFNISPPLKYPLLTGVRQQQSILKSRIEMCMKNIHDIFSPNRLRAIFQLFLTKAIASICVMPCASHSFFTYISFSNPKSKQYLISLETPNCGSLLCIPCLIRASPNSGLQVVYCIVCPLDTAISWNQ